MTMRQLMDDDANHMIHSHHRHQSLLESAVCTLSLDNQTSAHCSSPHAILVTDTEAYNKLVSYRRKNATNENNMQEITNKQTVYCI